MNPPPVLEVADLSVRIAGNRVLDGVDLAVGAGERVALVGESGCGKSTTALAVMGLLPAEARVSAALLAVGGKPLLELDEKGRRGLRGRAVALVPQEAGAALNPLIGVGSQVIAVLRRVHGLDRRAARRRAADLFKEVGLDADTVLAARPHELSGGQCQRVMIAMALGCEPRLIIADEPAAALDVITQARVMERLSRMTRERGTALLLISHDLAMAGAWCERGLVMYCGRIVEAAPLSSLLRQPAHPYTAGLLASVPRLDTRGTRLRTIPGYVPPPDALPPGCHFEPRCPRATARCRESRPPLVPAGDSQAACIHPLTGPEND
jgi:oligopeptide/dipeptide ABC transporter ATP-binding protein